MLLRLLHVVVLREQVLKLVGGEEGVARFSTAAAALACFFSHMAPRWLVPPPRPILWWGQAGDW